MDTHAYAQYVMPSYYDSLIAKLVAHAATGDEAIARLARALDEFIVEGVKTTIGFHRKAVASEAFRSGRFDTGFVAGAAAGRTAARPSASALSGVRS